jgi:hypothetical protein
MKIVSYETVRQNQADTRTVQQFTKLIGQKPAIIGMVAQLYPYLAVTTLTVALRNVYYNDNKTSKFTPQMSNVVEWQIKVNFIKKVTIVETPTLGSGRDPFRLKLDERYFDKNDVMRLENRQSLRVIANPEKISDRVWVYTVVPFGANNTSIDPNYVAAKRTVRYLTAFYPEMSQRGFIKYISNTEIHRNYMTKFRASSSWSAQYASTESTFVQVPSKDKAGKNSHMYYELKPIEKETLDKFMMDREHGMLFLESNYDQNGKCLDIDEDGQDVPAGDGIVPQIERYADKFVYSVLQTTIFENMMQAMNAKADAPIGNIYTLMCNEILWQQINTMFKNDERFRRSADNAWYYSKLMSEKGMSNKIFVGSTFQSYEFAGNTINFVVDRALSTEYPTQGYGIVLDSGIDVTTSTPNIQMHTIKGMEMLSGYVNGLGGKTGTMSGDIATGQSGSQYHLMGYGCATVYNPYKAAILIQSVLN